MSAPIVCFGHQTAFQILRTTVPNNRPFLRAGIQTLPAQAPNERDLESIIKLLENSFPGMRAENPVHLLVANSTGRRRMDAYKSHVCSTPLHGRSLHRLCKGVLVSSAPLALVQLAAQEKRKSPCWNWRSSCAARTKRNERAFLRPTKWNL